MKRSISKRFKRSDIEAMLNYYKRNYPREPYTEDPSAPVVKTQMSVLMFHGLGDTALLSGRAQQHLGLDGQGSDAGDDSWRGAFRADRTCVPDLVSRTMRAWLLR